MCEFLKYQVVTMNKEVEQKSGLRWSLLLLDTLSLLFITYQMIKLALYILVHIDMIDQAERKCDK